VYLTYKGNGSTGFFADWNYLTQNFLLSNYESQEGIDNDGKCLQPSGERRK